jgi:hypothetical protein
VDGITADALEARWAPVAAQFLGAICTLDHDKHYRSVSPRLARVRLEGVYARGLLFRALAGPREFVSWADLLAGHIRVREGSLGTALALAVRALPAAAGWS